MIASTAESVEKLLREELVRGDAVIAGAPAILRHLLASEHDIFFSEQVVARVRGQVRSIARQLLFALAGAVGVEERGDYCANLEEGLATALTAEPALLSHVHALTIEAQLIERLRFQSGIDPVLSPLLETLAGSGDETSASLAMAIIAAQARFLQRQLRMALPLEELPGDLFHLSVQVLEANTGHNAADLGVARKDLCEKFDESRGRLGLIDRMVMLLKGDPEMTLDLEQAGVPIFATALAIASGQERERAILSFSDRHLARFTLSLRAAGLKRKSIASQFFLLHPDIELPEVLETLGPKRAADLLAGTERTVGF